MSAKKSTKTAPATQPAESTPTRNSPTCKACGGKIGGRTIKCPHCGHIKEPKEKKASGTAEAKATDKAPATIDQMQFIRVMINKGWKYEKMVNAFTNEVIKETVPPQIEKLGLTFEAIPKNADGVYITQTSPQIQVAMPLDKFLEIAGLKP